MNVTIVLLFLALAAIALIATMRKAPPAITLGLWVMSASAGVVAFAPLHLSPLSVGSAVIVLAGMVAVALPGLMQVSARAHTPIDQGDPSVAFARLVLLTALVLVLTIVGFRSFVDSIQDATGQGFDSLSFIQVRAAQNGAARGGGLLALLGSLGGLLGCLGIYGALRYSWVWLVFPALSVWMALQNPSRLNSISLLIVLVVFYLYLRRPLGRSQSPSKRRRILPILTVIAVTAGAIALFNVVGIELGKNQAVAAQFPDYDWPAWTLSPFLYFGGGFPAFSQALSGGGSPFDPGASFFSFYRVLNLISPGVKVPDTIGQYVGIPGLFNLYTGPGQLYFDVGLVGTVLVLVLTGWLAVLAHRRALAGYPEWAWISALMFTVLLSLPQSFVLFHLDLDFEMLAGFGILTLIRRAHRSTSIAHSTGRTESTALSPEPEQWLASP